MHVFIWMLILKKNIDWLTILSGASDVNTIDCRVIYGLFRVKFDSCCMETSLCIYV
jgi:hypothetical protein